MSHPLGNPDIIALFKAIAKQHSMIQHEEGGDATVVRYFGFNPDELSALSRSLLNTDKLVLGLSSSLQPGTTIQYRDGGTATQKIKAFDVLILGCHDSGDNYPAEEVICAKAEQVGDDIQSWLYMTANSANAEHWPVVDLIDLNNVACRRMNKVDIGEWCGLLMRFTLRDNHMYNSGTNPLHNLQA